MKEHSVALAEVKEAIKVDHKQRKLQFIFNFDSDKKQLPLHQEEATKSVQKKRSRESIEATKSVQTKHSRELIEATKNVQTKHSLSIEATKNVQTKHSRESSEATKIVPRKCSRESIEATKSVQRKRSRESSEATKSVQRKRSRESSEATKRIVRKQPKITDGGQDYPPAETRTATQAQEMGRTAIEAPRTRTATQAQEMGRTVIDAPQTQEPLPSSPSHHPHSIENIVRQRHIPTQPVNIAMSPPTIHPVLPYPTSPPVSMLPFIPMGSPPFVPFPSFPLSPSRAGGVYPMEYYPTLMPYQYDGLSVSYYSPSYLMPTALTQPMSSQPMPPQPMPSQLMPPQPMSPQPMPSQLMPPQPMSPQPLPLLHPMNIFEQPSIQQLPHITEHISTEPPALKQPVKLTSKPANQQIKSEVKAAPLSQAPVVPVETPVLLTPPCSGSDELTDTDTIDAPQATSEAQGVCAICDEEGTDMLVCNGHCTNMFHVDCLGLMAAPRFKFVCDECVMDAGKCFVCSKPGQLVKCSKSKCPKLYHLSCINNNKLFVFDERKKKFTCALHMCGRCVSIGVADPSSTNLVQCTLCPLALHKTHCLIAGCQLLSPTHMVCYQHLKVTKNERLYSHINLNTCMDCGLIGSLFCCDVCSAAYHEDCLESEYRPGPDQETWKCPSCLVHDLPTYGALVLCKFGMWR